MSRYLRLSESVQYVAEPFTREEIIDGVINILERPHRPAGQGFRFPSEPQRPDAPVTVRCAFCRWYTRGKVRDMKALHQAHMSLKHPEKL